MSKQRKPPALPRYAVLDQNDPAAAFAVGEQTALEAFGRQRLDFHDIEPTAQLLNRDRDRKVWLGLQDGQHNPFGGPLVCQVHARDLHRRLTSARDLSTAASVFEWFRGRGQIAV